MATRVAINGFGRIGRTVLRVLCQRDSSGIELVAINDPGDIKSLAHLLRYDSVHGIWGGSVELDGQCLIVDGTRISVSGERDLARLHWGDMGVDVVLECTGVFTKRQSCEQHLAQGANKVVVSAPAEGADITLCLGVNDHLYDPDSHHIISNASCTTNCLAPIAKVVHDLGGIERGFMTTCHAYTNDQRLLDASHKDPRRSRAAATSVVPTSTGAAKAIGLVLPELEGKLDGNALRVPVPCGSVVDLVALVGRQTSVEEVNSALKSAAEGPMRGVLQYTEEPLVSIDIVGNPHSSIVDGQSTMVNDRLVKVLSWYDNEWGYSSRLVDCLEKLF